MTEPIKTPQPRKLEWRRPALYPKQRDVFFNDKRYSICEATTKAGKAQPLDALVWTPHGAMRFGDLRIGSLITAPDGTQCNVVGIYPQGERAIYRITFADGSTCEADGEHLWEVHSFDAPPRRFTTIQIAAFSVRTQHRFWIPRIQPVPFVSSPVPLDPYLMGVLLGDGSMTTDTVRLSSADMEIVDAVRALLPPEHEIIKNKGENHDWAITCGKRASRIKKEGKHIRQMVRALGIDCHSFEKFVPDIYRINSVSVRMAILQGLLDTDGFVDKHHQPGIEQTSSRLADDITFIVRSLGGTILTRKRLRNGYVKNGEYIECRAVYRQVIRFADAQWCFRLPRKRDKVRAKIKFGHRMFREITFSRMAQAQCIEIDHPSHLYLTNDFIPTHNTVGGMTWIVEKGLRGRAGQNRWWVAPVVPQAEIAYNRIKRGLPSDLIRCWSTDRIIELPNKSLLHFKSGEKPDNLYGEDVFDCVLDEVTRMREEAFVAVRSTLTATRGQLRLIGNVKGRQNFAYRLARKAQAGEPDWYYDKITWKDAVAAGILDEAEIDDARRTLRPEVFKELYEAEPSDDGGNPFGLGAIARIIGPLSSAPPVVWGIDLAKSVDWTVAIGLDRQGHTCRVERWQSPWPETKTRIKQLVGNTKAYVDSTGVGDPIVDDLQRQGGRSNYEGFKFSSTSKQMLMEGLAAAIQGNKITIPDGIVRKELEDFEYEYTRTGVKYSAPQGLHDDCVCALALAVYHMIPRNSLFAM